MADKPVLAFDCTTQHASIALAAGGEVRTLRLDANRHAAELIPAIDQLVREASLQYTQLLLMVTTVGPGSFTGVRIGLAALHGLALAASLPVKTLTSLEAMAWAVAIRQNPPTDFHVGLRAGKGEAYMQRFCVRDTAPQPMGDIFLCAEGEATNHAPYFGNLQPTDHPNFLEAPDAAVLCRIAHLLPDCTLERALPLYIRPPDAAIAAPLPWLA
ncbi:MAG: tRNA (adenosine(37)-N6)-threonylcarbamoyltransferase complex dimerization subunit type 1 TsaB [Rickettsiales bacterium]